MLQDLLGKAEAGTRLFGQVDDVALFYPGQNQVWVTT